MRLLTGFLIALALFVSLGCADEGGERAVRSVRKIYFVDDTASKVRCYTMNGQRNLSCVKLDR